MATVREAAAVALGGEPTGVVLIGEAGVGKTRLVSELAGELERDGAVVATSHGVQLSGGELPYAGIAELVRGLVRGVGPAELTRAAGRELRALGAFDRALGDEQAPDRTAVTAAVLAVVEGLGRRRSVVWIVDDLQWLDGASRDLVSYVVRVARDASLLLLATVRDSSFGGDSDQDPALELARASCVTTLQVRPLGEEAVGAQARSLSRRPLQAAELERIRRLSDGLPFFVEELVAADGATPTTLHTAVIVSTRDLVDQTRLLLRATALEETVARPDLVAEVAGLADAELAAALAEARDRDILRVDRDRDVLRFRHALLREAVEEELLASERRALHRRWAKVLDRLTDEPAAPSNLVVTRARHWHLAGDPAAAFPAVLAAARYADGIEDQAAQAYWWERVLQTWPETGDPGISRDRVLYNLLLSLVGTGEVRRALTSIRHELEASDETYELRALWLLLTHRHLAKFARDLRGVPPAPNDADALLAWLRTLDPDFRVNAVLHFLLHEWDGERPDLYLPICDELERRGGAEGDLDTWYLAMRHRGWWQQSQGDFEGQLTTVRTAREVVLEKIPSRRLEAEWDWCWGLEEAGRYSEALAAAEAALAQVDEPRAVLALWQILVGCVVAAHSALGDWDAAETWLAKMASGPGVPVDFLRARLSGEIAARRGDINRAEAELRSIADMTTPDRALSSAALAAEIAVVAADGERAGQALDDIEGVPHAVGNPDDVVQALLCLSRTAGSPGDGLMLRALDVSGRLLPAGGAVQAAARAELTEHECRVAGADSSAGWAAVAAAWHALGRVYDVAWCRHLQALAAIREGDRENASFALAEAWAIAGRLGAAPLRGRVAASARRARLSLDGLTGDTVANLTERETEVLRLLALGRTNAQIAEQLVISPKTASVHVSRILAKLGATNRTEAAAAARRLGVA